MRPATLALSLWASLAGGEPAKGKVNDKHDPDGVKALAGEWSLASTADENREHPGNKLSRMAVTQGGEVRFLLDGSQTNSGTFTPAKAAGKLKAIDLKLSGGKVVRGVYGFDGDALVLCFAEEGKPRPTSLKPAGTQWAERWQRVGKEKKPKANRCVEPAAETDEERS
jgi:uncharacterized protein (TIGR03067 family)